MNVIPKIEIHICVLFTLERLIHGTRYEKSYDSFIDYVGLSFKDNANELNTEKG